VRRDSDVSVLAYLTGD
jgi:nucleoside-diphosphate-sugar epimerase